MLRILYNFRCDKTVGIFGTICWWTENILWSLNGYSRWKITRKIIFRVLSDWKGVYYLYYLNTYVYVYIRGTAYIVMLYVIYVVYCFSMVCVLWWVCGTCVCVWWVYGVSWMLQLVYGGCCCYSFSISLGVCGRVVFVCVLCVQRFSWSRWVTAKTN